MNIGCCIRDPILCARLADLLSQEGFDCELFKHESAIVRTLRHRGGIDLLLIDIGHDPAMEEGVLSWLRCRNGDTVPVLLMSSHWNPQRVAQVLEAGADDCIPKPFDGAELIARMRAVLRRCRGSEAAPARTEIAGFVLDEASGVLTDQGKVVELTPREFALAWLFFANPGQRLARDAISLAIWGSEKEIASRTIEQHVYKLRKKMNLGVARGVVIRTTYGQGYRLEHCEPRARRPASVSMSAAANRLARLDAQRNASVV